MGTKNINGDLNVVGAILQNGTAIGGGGGTKLYKHEVRLGSNSGVVSNTGVITFVCDVATHFEDLDLTIEQKFNILNGIFDSTIFKVFMYFGQYTKFWNAAAISYEFVPTGNINGYTNTIKRHPYCVMQTYSPNLKILFFNEDSVNLTTGKFNATSQESGNNGQFTIGYISDTVTEL